MKKSPVFLFALLALNAFAFDGRPVSDLRFEGNTPVGDYRIATDGTGFLVLSRLIGVGSSGTPAVFAQRVGGDGQPMGPHRQIGLGGSTAGLGWTGSHYLAAWRNGQNIQVVSVSREGTPTAVPFTIDATHMAADSRGALAFRFRDGKLGVQRLEPTGKPVGVMTTHDAPTSFATTAVGAVAGGFGVVFSGFQGTWLMAFRTDGSSITNAPILIDGPYDGTTTDRHSETAAVATNGAETMVVYGTTKIGEPTELKTARLGADGTLKSGQVVKTFFTSAFGNHALQPFGLLWDGTQYVAGVTVRTDFDSADPALLRIASSGAGIDDFAWLAQTARREVATALASNGREVVVPLHDTTHTILIPPQSFSIIANAATLAPRDETMMARTLSSQHGLTIEAIPGGYLAGWVEAAATQSTVRVSRLDAAGNYLDGEGIVIATGPRRPPPAQWRVSIDVSGPRWLVAWSAWGSGGQFLSRRATPEGPSFPMPSDAAVRWNGSHYVVLFSDWNLNQERRSASWALLDEKVLTESNEEDGIFYSMPSLVRLGNRLLGVYVREDVDCPSFFPGDCAVDSTVIGYLPDTPEAAPFTIVGPFGQETEVSVAAHAGSALVMWREFPSMRGVLLPAGAPEQVGSPFVIDDGSPSIISVETDGDEFFAAWLKQGLRAARITSSGAVLDRRTLSFGPGESVGSLVVAAGKGQSPLIAFAGSFALYDSVPRVVLLFPSEMTVTNAAPLAPRITCASRIEDGKVRVQWEPVENAFGVAIELQLADDTFRTIGVASSDASSATVPLPGLEGSSMRLRAWNSFGFSAASEVAPNLPAPDAVVHANPFACAGVPVEVTASLRGTAPFVVQWSDGFTQHVSDGSTATRVVTLDHDTTLSVVTVSDASCEVGTFNGGVDIHVTAEPRIDQQSSVVRVARNEPATLSVVTAAHGTRFAWYEGARGDTAHPVGSNNATFTTPPATRTMQFWVRLTTSCGSVDSDGMAVIVNGRRRAVR